ncbi:MAG TPA: hypothetical protein VF807_01775 [Ktedonobacterales bacterium]
MAGDNGQQGGKPQIVGQSRTLSDEEQQDVTSLIRDAQRSHRASSIPRQDLDAQATTALGPEAAKVITESKVMLSLQKFDRDFLYGMGRFDEYQGGVLLKWGDGYSRKHIWVSVEGDHLIFETSHERKCSKPWCEGGRHVFTPEQWHDLRLINEELADQLRRPIQERSDD